MAQEVSCISGTYCQVQRLLLAIPHVHTKQRGTCLQPLAGILQYSGREIVYKISIHRNWKHLALFRAVWQHCLCLTISVLWSRYNAVSDDKMTACLKIYQVLKKTE